MEWKQTINGKDSSEFDAMIKHILAKRTDFLEAHKATREAHGSINRDDLATQYKGIDASKFKASSRGLKYLEPLQQNLDDAIKEGKSEAATEALAAYNLLKINVSKAKVSAIEVSDTLAKIHAKYAGLVEKLTNARDALQTLDGMLDLPAPAPAPAAKPATGSFIPQKSQKEDEGRNMFEDLKANLNEAALDEIAKGVDVKELCNLKKAVADAEDYSSLIEAEYALRTAVALAKEDYAAAADLKKEKEAKLLQYKTDITDAIAEIVKNAPTAWGDGEKKPAHEEDIAKANKEKANKEAEANQQFAALKAQLTEKAIDEIVKGSKVDAANHKAAVEAATDYPSLVEAEAALRIAVAVDKEDYAAAGALKKDKETKLDKFKSDFTDAIAALETQISDWETEDATAILAKAVKEPEPAPAPAATATDSGPKETFDPEQIVRVNEALNGFRKNPLFGNNAKDIDHTAAHKHGKGDYVVAKEGKTVEYVKAVTQKALAILENLQHLPKSEADLKAWYDNVLKTTTWSADLSGEHAKEGFDSLSYNVGLMQMVDSMGQELYGLVGLRDSTKYPGDVKYDLE